MKNAILMSIAPKQRKQIENGEQTIIVRKTRPQLETPFKVYIRKTNGSDNVIGEFICNKIDVFFARYDDHGSADLTPSKLIYGLGNADKELAYLDKCCLTHDELFDYIIPTEYGYGLHIPRLKIYNKAKKLDEIQKDCVLCEVKE